jgi:hypothetical protein
MVASGHALHLVPEPPINDPPPTHLAEPEKEIWRSVIGQCPPAATAVLESALSMHQHARKMREVIDRDGLWTIGKNGRPKAHPLLSHVRSCHKLFQQAFKMLGLARRYYE